MTSEQLGLGPDLAPPWTVMPGGRATAHTQSLRGGELGERLWHAGHALKDFFWALAQRHGFPTHIGIEKPHAASLQRIPVRQYELQGVILESLWGASRPGAPPQVGLVSPSSWKASAIGKGHGHAKPPEYVAWARRTFDWAPSRERPDDEAAALGVATHVALQVAGGGVLRGASVVWGIDPQMPRVSVGVLVP